MTYKYDIYIYIYGNYNNYHQGCLRLEGIIGHSSHFHDSMRVYLGGWKKRVQYSKI